MRILYFGGGLGNQIFEYTFYLAIREHFPEEDIRGIYLNSKFKEHEGGLELENVFNVKLPPTSLKAKLLTGLIYLWKKIHPKTNLYFTISKADRKAEYGRYLCTDKENALCEDWRERRNN